MPTPGGELIRAMAAGNRDAFAQLYDRYAALVLAFVLRIVRERADAVEVLQDVFWEAWRGAAAYDPSRGTPEAWIITRARTRAIDRVRPVRRRGETFVAAPAGPPPPPGGDAVMRADDRQLVAVGRAPGGLGEWAPPPGPTAPASPGPPSTGPARWTATPSRSSRRPCRPARSVRLLSAKPRTRSRARCCRHRRRRRPRGRARRS